MATHRFYSYIPEVTGLLRFIGVVNASIWFGASFFFTFVGGPGIFSRKVAELFGEKAFTYYAGGVAVVIIGRLFILQNVCAIIALLHIFAEWLYLSRMISRITLGLVLTIFCLGLLGEFALEPHMNQLRKARYTAPAQEQREKAQRSFGIWHGISQAGNLVILGGLLVYLMQVTRPPEALRYATFPKFRS